MQNSAMHCPRCSKLLQIDSVREHANGRKRVYWECKECNLSIMERGKEPEGENQEGQLRR